MPLGLPLALLLSCAPPDRGCEGRCDADEDGVRAGRDCDDGRADVHPGAPEVCDGVDDDCDGLVDDADPDLDDAGRIDLFADLDLDGHGGEPTRACAVTRGLADAGGDCDDADPSVHPGATETCDAVDRDCDGVLGPDDPDRPQVVSFRDRDGDGHGDPAGAEARCPGEEWSTDALDCDDGRATVGPGMPEVCDGIDDDCDGVLLPDEEIDLDADGDPTCADCDDLDPERSTRIEERCGDLPVDEDCDGLVDDADPSLNPYTCGFCPPADLPTVEAVPVHDDTWNPCVLDPAATALCSTDPASPDTHTSGERLHQVSWREDEGHWRDELFLWLPPGPGKTNDHVRRWAAYAGYRVVALGFPNDDTLDGSCGVGAGAAACYEAALYEIQYGVDVSGLITVSAADSVEGRLVTLLEHLSVEHPEMGFDRYVQDGRPAWDHIVAAGWSGGGAQAAFAAHYEQIDGVLLLSAPKDHTEVPLAPLDWVTAPMVTPGCAIYATWHVDEPLCAPPESLLERAWDAMGVPATTFDLDLAAGDLPPAGTHRIVQTVDVGTLPKGCSAHASVARDPCVRPEAQLPEYLYLLCSVSDTPDCY